MADGLIEHFHSEEDTQKYLVVSRAYGDVIATTAQLDGEVFDISWLPASKEEIKKALLWQLKNNPEIKNQIITVYGLLGKFQPDVGPYIPSVISQHDREMRERFGLDEDVDLPSFLLQEVGENNPKAIIFAEKWVELSEPHTVLMEKWEPIIKSESAQLHQELIDLGYLPKDFEEQTKNLAELMLKEIDENRKEPVPPENPEPLPKLKSHSLGTYVAWAFAFAILLMILRALFLNP